MPNGFWPSIIGGLQSFLGSYGVAIILLTIVIKILLLPTDYLQRKSSMKMTKIQKAMQEVQAKYGDNKEKLNQKQMEIFKAGGGNPITSCLGTLLSVVLSLVVFMTLLTGLNDAKNSVTVQQYDLIREAYYEVNTTDVEERNQAAYDKYNEVKIGFLWIENLWLPDTAQSPIMSFEQYNAIANIDEAQVETAKIEYEKIMNPLREKVRKTNGFYILVILAALSSFLMMFFNNLSQNLKEKKKKKEQSDQTDNERKAQDAGRILSADGKREKPVAKKNQSKVMQYVMMFLLPVIILFVAINYTAAFALYMVVNFFLSIATNKIFSKVIKNDDDKKEERHQQALKPEYSRY